jgi:hypothetical protein
MATTVHAAIVAWRHVSIAGEHIPLGLGLSTRATFRPKIGGELARRPEAVVLVPRLRQSGLGADLVPRVVGPH